MSLLVYLQLCMLLAYFFLVFLKLCPLDVTWSECIDIIEPN
jgi:hypothetical protein